MSGSRAVTSSRLDPRAVSNRLRLDGRSHVPRLVFALLWLAVLAPESRAETAAAFPPPTATMFRQIDAVVQLTFESGAPLVYNDSGEAFGPAEGAFQDIVAANVSDLLPFPSGSANAGAYQSSDLASTSSNGDWLFDGDGNAFGDVDVSADNGSNGSLFAVSVANTTFDVAGPTAGYLDAELSSSLTTATGSFIASMSICRVSGACLVDLSVADTNPALQEAEQVGFHGPLVFPEAGTYQMRLRAQASAGVTVPGVGTGFVESAGQASWDAVLTVPEPAARQLGLAAVMAIVAIRRRR